MDTDLMATLAQRPMLCDGGMGTQLIHAGLPSNTASEWWNLERPEVVERVHRAYCCAGCELMTTNTFGGTVAALQRHGLGTQADAINEAGARLARCGGEGVSAWVLGDIGPFGGFLEPFGEYKPEDVQAMFHEQAAALQRGGADAIVVETMSDPNEAVLAIAAAREFGPWPIIATFAFSKSPGGNFRTMMGADVATSVAAAIGAGADVVGANCGTALDLDDYRRLADQLLAATGPAPVIVQPNAGAPNITAAGTVYPATPEEMAVLARDLVERGVRIIGGCCGTTPEHLSHMAEVVR